MSQAINCKNSINEPSCSGWSECQRPLEIFIVYRIISITWISHNTSLSLQSVIHTMVVCRVLPRTKIMRAEIPEIKTVLDCWLYGKILTILSHHRWYSHVGVMPMNSTYIDWCWWCDPGRVAGECGGRGLIRRSAQTSVEFGVFLCTRRTRPNKHGTEIFCKYPTVKYFPESDDCTALRSSLVVINNQSDFNQAFACSVL